MTQAVVHILKAIQIEKQHRELIIVVLPGALNHELQVLSQQRAVRQLGQRVVECRVTKMVLALLQLDADSFLFGNMPAQLFDVPLSLLGAFALSLCPGSFCFGPIVLGLLCQC